MLLFVAIMGKKQSKSGMISSGLVAANRRARHDYELCDEVEAGIVLLGTEVKSMRAGQANIAEAHVGDKGGALFLMGANIAPYMQAGTLSQHEPTRPRALLLKKRQANKLMGAASKDGYTIVPLRLYFNDKGIAKISIALGKGKKLHDKRQTEKKRDWDRQKAKIMREHS